MLAANTVLVPEQLFNWFQETLWNVEKKRKQRYNVITAQSHRRRRDLGLLLRTCMCTQETLRYELSAPWLKGKDSVAINAEDESDVGYHPDALWEQ